MKVVSYAYFFVLDFLINILYTILFASIWFLIVSDSDTPPPIGGKTFDSVKDAQDSLIHSIRTLQKSHILQLPMQIHLKVNMQVLSGRRAIR